MKKTKYKNTVVLLGAGASIEWVKDGAISTSELTCFVFELLQSEGWIKSLEIYCEMDNQIVNQCNSVVFDILLKARDKYIDFNFETIIALVDIIGTINQTSDDSYFSPNLVRHIYELGARGKLEEIEYGNILLLYPVLLRYFLIKHFFSLCHDEGYKSGMRDELIQGTKKFIKKLGDSVSIISLNYDIFFQEIVQELGYFNGFNSEKEPMDSYRLFRQPKKIIYPHGSIHLFNSIFDQKSLFEVKWIRDKCTMSNNILGNISKLYSQSAEHAQLQKGLFFSQSIISGIDKQEIVSASPFSDYYFEAVNVLSQEDTLLVIIGYSFTDDHINSLLERHLRLNKLPIVIIDKISCANNMTRFLGRNVLEYAWPELKLQDVYEQGYYCDNKLIFFNKGYYDFIKHQHYLRCQHFS